MTNGPGQMTGAVRGFVIRAATSRAARWTEDYSTVASTAGTTVRVPPAAEPMANAV
jgi:hypothetical protein